MTDATKQRADPGAAVRRHLTPKVVAAGRAMTHNCNNREPKKIGDMSRGELLTAIRDKLHESGFTRRCFFSGSDEVWITWSSDPMLEFTDDELIGIYAMVCKTLKQIKRDGPLRVAIEALLLTVAVIAGTWLIVWLLLKLKVN